MFYLSKVYNSIFPFVLTIMIISSCSDRKTVDVKKIENTPKQQTTETELDKNAIKIINDYYLMHFNLWTSNIGMGTMDNKIDSIQQIYCTNSLINRYKESSSMGHDLMTYDYGLDSLALSSFNVRNYKNNDQIYIIEYETMFEIHPRKKEKTKVRLILKLVNENGALKIDDVKGYKP